MCHKSRSVIQFRTIERTVSGCNTGTHSLLMMQIYHTTCAENVKTRQGGNLEGPALRRPPRGTGHAAERRMTRRVSGCLALSAQLATFTTKRCRIAATSARVAVP